MRDAGRRRGDGDAGVARLAGAHAIAVFINDLRERHPHFHGPHACGDGGAGDVVGGIRLYLRPVEEGVAGEGFVGVEFFQTAHHALAHGVEFGAVGFAKRCPKGVAIRFAGFDGAVHPACFLRVLRVAQGEAVACGQCLFAGAVVG